MEVLSINNLSKGNAEIFVCEFENKYYWLLADFDELYLKKISSDNLEFYAEIPKSLFIELVNLGAFEFDNPASKMAEMIRNNPK